MGLHGSLLPIIHRVAVNLNTWFMPVVKEDVLARTLEFYFHFDTFNVVQSVP